jgi:hypothetical protein
MHGNKKKAMCIAKEPRGRDWRGNGFFKKNKKELVKYL